MAGARPARLRATQRCAAKEDGDVAATGVARRNTVGHVTRSRNAIALNEQRCAPGARPTQ
ncbi:MAG: hypothetical protein ACR2PF_11725 [Rhizobiaceae bacterium]